MHPCSKRVGATSASRISRACSSLPGLARACAITVRTSFIIAPLWINKAPHYTKCLCVDLMILTDDVIPDHRRSLTEKAPRATDESIPQFIESQRAVRLSRKADAGGNPDLSGRLDRGSEPKRALRRTQIQTILRLVDPHGLGKSAW